MNKNAVVVYPLIIALILFLSLLTPAYARYSGGTGDPNTPYKISDFNDLMALRADSNDWNRCFILTADIDLDPNLPGRMVFATALIAKDTSTGSNFEGTPFTGVFDGNNLKITNLKIDTGGLANCYLGLFGRIGSGGIIKNLAIEYCSITGGSSSQYLGGLCGYNYYGNITNCYATGNITGGSYLGGLCGYNINGTISNCCAMGNITGGANSYDLGGLCGYNDRGTISNCCAVGSVTGGVSSWYLGGLCGHNSSGTIANCYATGSVSGRSYVGGLCGYNSGTGSTISNCYAAGAVSGSSSAGGLCAVNSGKVLNCYFLLGAGPDNNIGEPLSASQMKQQANFIGWDFDEQGDGDPADWLMPIGNYPALAWETLVSIPDVIGLDPNDAIAVLQAQGINYILKYKLEGLPIGRISSQFPMPGGQFGSNHAVEIVVSTGIKYSGGSGMPQNPYRIAAAADINDITNNTEDFDA